ncbi:MAG TPA: family 43 glycosylhydrolase, partial [Dehalococcoidia bacterium]
MRLLAPLLVIAAITSACLSFSGASHNNGAALPYPLGKAASRLGASVASVYQIPVLDQNFPDPDVFEADGVFYSFATNSNRSNIQAARSDDLIDWTPLPDALPELAPWAQRIPDMVWAPEVIKLGDTYRMYYVAHDRASGRQCIGVASSATPQGPYRDTSARPLICPPGFERALDPNPF